MIRTWYIALVVLGVCVAASPTFAQTNGAAAPEPNAQAPQTPTADDTMTVNVAVKHGSSGEPVAESPVFLRAARPRGPFEPTAPEPQAEWTGFTDHRGIATFDQIPRDLMTSGLRVHAVTTYDGLAFSSAQTTPADGSQVELQVWDKELDTSVVAIHNLRTVVEIWENYLVFTQYYTLTNDGETALDVKLLPDEEYEKGLPIRLPIKAQGINVSGPGDNMVVESTIFWKGVLEPGARVNLQARFSMSARDPEFTYEQTVDYPTHNVEVVVPIQTRFEKVPRLDDLELRPAGFSERDRGNGIFGLRDDIEFVGARGLKLDAGQSFTFQLRGLPFRRARLPWVFLGLGLLMAICVLVFGRRESKRERSEEGRQQTLSALRQEREALLDELVALENDLDAGLVTDNEYAAEAAGLREQLALVLKKIDDLR